MLQQSTSAGAGTSTSIGIGTGTSIGDQYVDYHLTIDGLRYLFDQPNLNARQDRWLATLSEFDLKIKYIKGKENRVANAPSRKVQVNHIATMSSYGTEL